MTSAWKVLKRGTPWGGLKMRWKDLLKKRERARCPVTGLSRNQVSSFLRICRDACSEFRFKGEDEKPEKCPQGKKLLGILPVTRRCRELVVDQCGIFQSPAEVIEGWGEDSMPPVLRNCAQCSRVVQTILNQKFAKGETDILRKEIQTLQESVNSLTQALGGGHNQGADES